ncbi:MAG: hypothetical protein IJ002_03195 [Clostridia bacterium]|nr:hypothetical protein [Clostridia bacterium]MBQ8836498.1 hypothetical protein [Clostridia bacterium]
MKKISVLILAVLMFMSLTGIFISAEDGAEVSYESETVTEANSEYEDSAALEDYAEEFFTYLLSGEDGAGELMDRIIAIGEQYRDAKEAGYTFKERIYQLLTPENIVTTVAAAFIFIIGIAFFIFRHYQKLDIRAIHSDVSYLKKNLEEEREENKQLREIIERQDKHIEELTASNKLLTESTEKNKSDTDRVSNMSAAVAKMVKDVFLNSKTIDASGKALLVHNYMEAVGKDETVSDAAQKDGENE